MPIYEFDCLNCNHHFEELCAMNDVTGVTCPKCQNTNTKRLMSKFGIGHGVNSGSQGHTGSKCGSCSGGHCTTCH